MLILPFLMKITHLSHHKIIIKKEIVLKGNFASLVYAHISLPPKPSSLPILFSFLLKYPYF